MRNDKLQQANFKVMLEGTKDAIVKHWESIITAISKIAAVIKYDAETGIVLVMGESGLLALVGKIKDALKSIYFGLDVSVSKI